jgi:hypothetical protein
MSNLQSNSKNTALKTKALTKAEGDNDDSDRSARTPVDVVDDLSHVVFFETRAQPSFDSNTHHHLAFPIR